MTGCKHSLWRILSVTAALAFVLPRVALGELGVCPPYSKTFGPDDPENEITAFLDEINLRPGGGTLILEPGSYFGGGMPYTDTVSITGIVCIRSSDPDSQRAGWGERLLVQGGALLTLRGVEFSAVTDFHGHVVDEGATLFFDHGSFSVQGVDETVEGFLEVAGTAYLNEVTIGGDEGYSGIKNTGTLVMTGGGISARTILRFDALQNYGYAMLDRVSIENNGGYQRDGRGIVNYSGGVLNLENSIVADNGAWDCPFGDTDNVGIVNEAGGFVHVFSSTVANHVQYDQSCDSVPDTGIRNAGQLELENSVVTDACDPVIDLGYNVGSCAATQPTSIEADPELLPDDVELSGNSPAIDLIPLERCPPTDNMGRARTDGDADGIVACDAGALEYGYVGTQINVRTTPYWKNVGVVDLSIENTLFVTAFSDASVDATTIMVDSIYVEGFDARVRGPVYRDNNRDGLLDIAFWYRLDRDLDLDCGDYDQHFEALTEDGQIVTGQLRFVATGCTQ